MIKQLVEAAAHSKWATAWAGLDERAGGVVGEWGGRLRQARSASAGTKQRPCNHCSGPCGRRRGKGPQGMAGLATWCPRRAVAREFRRWLFVRPSGERSYWGRSLAVGAVQIGAAQTA